MAFACAAQLHLLPDGVVVLLGTVVGRADGLRVVVVVLLVLVPRMPPSARPGPLVGASIARSYHAQRYLTVVVVPQAF